MLDTKELNIKNVICEDTGKPVKYEVGKSVLTFGSPLTIHLPEDTKAE